MVARRGSGERRGIGTGGGDLQRGGVRCERRWRREQRGKRGPGRRLYSRGGGAMRGEGAAQGGGGACPDRTCGAAATNAVREGETVRLAGLGRRGRLGPGLVQSAKGKFCFFYIFKTKK